MDKGQVIGGEFGKILIRQKAETGIEIGELLVCDATFGKILLQVYDIMYGSQISRQNLELISGMMLEEGSDVEFMEQNLRNYSMAVAKNVLFVQDRQAKSAKNMPIFFSKVREVQKDDLQFLTKPEKGLYLGKLRSGSNVIDAPVYLDGGKVFSEHILIPATTGRGKSNLTSCMLFDCVGKDYCGMLVLDPHDEYYGRNGLGLKDHPMSSEVIYYSHNPPAGCRSLKINISHLQPSHFNGAITWTDAQKEAVSAYHKRFGKRWIAAIMLEENQDMLGQGGFQEGTLGVVRRKISGLLGLEAKGLKIFSEGAFDTQSGESTIADICTELEKARTVIIDTSNFSGNLEILVGTIITSEVFARYKRYKVAGSLRDKPSISVVLEEAPRVLGKEVLEKGPNIFSTIAREGRKFKVGLIAITQLPSLIPREILANMNTKIILGIEMAPERQAIIDSASQDLSSDQRNIASLDKGEAIITSNFTRFALPVKIPYFPDLVKETQNLHVKEKYIKKNYQGIGAG